jgi:hypothetical protein
MTSHELAVLFHSTYERLAPAFGWRTKKGCNVPFEQLPQRNKALMEATCQTVLNVLQEKSSSELPAHNTGSPKFPTLLEAVSGALGFKVSEFPDTDTGFGMRDMYNYICRQLRADA